MNVEVWFVVSAVIPFVVLAKDFALLPKKFLGATLTDNHRASIQLRLKFSLAVRGMQLFFDPLVC